MSSQQKRSKPVKDLPVFFYKPRENYGIFCQWYASAFTVSNADITSLVGRHMFSDSPDASTEFGCGEQFMMYCKAARFNDEKRQRGILRTSDPSLQKRTGRAVEGFEEEDWSEVKSKVVEMGNYAKFSQHEELRSWLLGTGDRELVEASGKDRVWGIGFLATTEFQIQVALENREHWGENLLGKALMVVRERIRREMATSGQEQANRL